MSSVPVSGQHEPDAAFATALHGHSAMSRGGLLSLCGKSHGTLQATVERYFSHWSTTSGAQESQYTREARRESYLSVTDSYYNIVTDMFEHFFFGKSFHFFRIQPGVPLSQASQDHEDYLSSKLQLSAGQNILDVGCGVGGPATRIASTTGVDITCLNNNDYQLQRASRYTAASVAAKVLRQGQMSYVKGDFMHMNFKPETFDAAYSIEATSYAPNLEHVYSEIYKALKPGGRLAVYELIMTDDYNDEDIQHRQLRFRLERGIGVSNLVTISEAITALRAAGFEIIEAEDLARLAEVSWTYPFSGSLRQLNSIWDLPRITWMAFVHTPIIRSILGLLELFRIFPLGSSTMIKSLLDTGGHLEEARQGNLFTPLFIMVGQKPLTST